MTREEFESCVERGLQPHGGPELLALWHDALGRWEQAHKVVQDSQQRGCAWVHAYLHRKEGDDENARYWYERARQPVSHDSLEAEWSQLVDEFIGAGAES